MWLIIIKVTKPIVVAEIIRERLCGSLTKKLLKVKLLWHNKLRTRTSCLKIIAQQRLHSFEIISKHKTAQGVTANVAKKER
jgi:hypothetical protein